MRINISKSIRFLLFLLPISFLQAQNIPVEIEKELNEIGDKMLEAALAGENVTIIDFYTDDVVVNPSFHSAIKGKKALLKLYQYDAKKGVKYHSFNATVEQRRLYGNEIFERGTFGLSVSSNESRKPQAYYGSYFQIWKKQSDGSYKIEYIIWNLDFNPFE